MTTEPGINADKVEVALERVALERDRVQLQKDRAAFEAQQRDRELDAREAELRRQRDALEQARVALDQARSQHEVDAAALRAEKESWYQTRRRVDPEELGERVTINAGGRKYTVLKETLAQARGLLGAKFSGRYKLDLDAEGCVFLDRDGDLFAHILDMARKGDAYVPPRSLDTLSLKAEMDYFGLPPFVAFKDAVIDLPRLTDGQVRFAKEPFALDSDYAFLRFQVLSGTQQDGATGDLGIHIRIEAQPTKETGVSEMPFWPVPGILVARVICQTGGNDRSLCLDMQRLDAAFTSKLLNGAGFGDSAMIPRALLPDFLTSSQQGILLHVELHYRPPFAHVASGNHLASH